MDFTSLLFTLSTGVFSAGAAVATIRVQIKQNAKDIEEVKVDVGKKLDRMDVKIDRIVDHLLADDRRVG